MATILGIRAYHQPNTYNAKLTFMVNEDEGGGVNGIGATLGQIGFGGGGVLVVGDEDGLGGLFDDEDSLFVS